MKGVAEMSHQKQVSVHVLPGKLYAQLTCFCRISLVYLFDYAMQFYQIELHA